MKEAVNSNEAINKAQFDKGLKDLSNSLQSEDSAVVLYDKNEDDNGSTNYKSVTFGKGKDSEPVAVHNVADGLIAKGSHDVVNGGQLYLLGDKVATYLGGNAKYENGAWTAPSFKVKTVNADGSAVEDKEYKTVAEALAGVGTFITKVQNKVTEQVNNVVTKVEGDSLSWSEGDSAFIAKHGEGNAKTSSKITFLTNGDITSDSTDAVNGSQIYSLSQQFAGFLGGGAIFSEGTWTAPAFKVKTVKDDGQEEETTYNNVAAAFEGVGSSFTNVSSKITKVQNEIKTEITNQITTVKGDNLIKQDEKTKVITIGGEKDGTSISIANSDGGARTLSGVKDGALSAVSMEAVNGSQLYQLSQTLALYFGGGAGYKDGAWTAPTFQVSQFKLDGSAGDKKVYDNVASAFEGVNGSMSSINDRINTVAQNVSSNSLNWNEEEGAYTAGHAGKDSKIMHVSDGTVSAGSKDAVNGGQLFETNERVTAVENQVSNIDKQVQNIESTVTNGVVKYDQDVEGHKSNKITLLGGNESDPVLIDNVSDGRIENGSKEAVNGGQLHDYTEEQMKVVLDDAKKYTDNQISSTVNNAVDESKSYTDMKFEKLSYAVEDVRKEARQAAAIGLAVSNLRYYDTPGSLSVSFGSGVWRSQSAFAIGAGYTSEDGNIRSNLSVTSAGGHWGVGAGITLRLR
ncbi:hypothetical protein MCO_01831 [Bartonella sp. DB5-6]|uniref:Vomp family autotransporter n=1 Tax=Bartonella sp. DB5-6 TaxID=1094755 RepID=UPI00026EA040|nr:Vomp family autotransporter [Bartonella sp. DB5-6]EJF74205.1 hypothetical protein MCO_01831 [Bartonella sp. DB5-6]